MSDPRDPATLVVATTNPGKIAEIRQLLVGVPLVIATLADFPPVEPVEETGTSFAENARLKALYYAAATGLLTVAEDSGLEIDALGGRPGVESARFGGAIDYPEKFAIIYEALAAVPDAPRGARFVCALALATPGAVEFEAAGTIEGTVAPRPSGQGGFGYDPIFFYEPFNATLADAVERKAAVSHRAKAFARLRRHLRDHGGPAGYFLSAAREKM